MTRRQRAFTIALAFLAAECARSKGGAVAPHTFAEAVSDLERITGAKGRPAVSPDEEPLDGVVFFETKPDVGARLVASNRARLRPSGAYLFLYDHGFGVKPDVVGLAPTSDKFDVVRRTRTDAANYGHDNAAVIAWLRELDREEPFELTGAGLDFV